MEHQITFIIDALTMGGAQRSVVAMANYWANLGHQVKIIVLRNSKPAQGLLIDPRIIVRTLSLNGGIFLKIAALPLLIYRLRKHLDSRAMILPFMDEIVLLTLISGVGLKAKIFACERTFPQESFNKYWDIFGYVQRALFGLRNFLYRRCAGIVVQTERAKEWFPKNLHQKIHVIPNACWPEKSGGTPPLLPAPAIVGLGRLSFEKGFDVLIDAFAQISHLHPEWTLVIFGTGPEFTPLELKIEARSLVRQIQLRGITATPSEVLSAADIFVLPSRVEGFPNVLLEALSAGKAVIASDCLAGPREILGDGKFGVLVPPQNSNALALELSALITDSARRETLSAAARTRANDFRPFEVMNRWESLLSMPEVG